MPPPPPPRYEKRLIVLYFDLDGTPDAIETAISYLQTQIQPTDLVAIMSGPGDARAVQDFTADHAKVTREIRSLTFRGVKAPAIDRSLDGLLNATNMLARLSGKKMVVYFMPLALSGLVGKEQLQPLIEAGQRANVAFFGIAMPAPQVI